MQLVGFPSMAWAYAIFGVGFTVAGAILLYTLAPAGPAALVSLVFLLPGVGFMTYLINCGVLTIKCKTFGTPMHAQVVEIVDDPQITINDYWACRLCCKADNGVDYYSRAIYAPSAQDYLGKDVVVYVNGEDYCIKYK